MKKVLVAYDSKTGRTQKMAGYIAEGIKGAGCEAEVRPIEDIKQADELNGYDGYVFGCPTYFKDATDEMKKFLLMARNADFAGKVGGSFGSYTHIGNAPKIVHDTMEYVYQMDMAEMGALNVKEQILDGGKGQEACQAYGKGIGDKLKG